VKGSIIDGSFVSVDAVTPGSCPSSGIKYLPKPGGGEGTTTTPTTLVDTTPTPIPTGVPTSGTISVLVSGTKTGGLLSLGTWSTQTPGRITVTESGSGFTLTSSKGKCGILSEKLTCGSNVTASVFTLVSRALLGHTQVFRNDSVIRSLQTTSGSNRLLTYEGSTAFTADSTPRGSTQVALFTGSARAVDVTLAFV
jgi:ribonuclease T2